jgi:hypothetical protein
MNMYLTAEELAGLPDELLQELSPVSQRLADLAMRGEVTRSSDYSVNRYSIEGGSRCVVCATPIRVGKGWIKGTCSAKCVRLLAR